MRIGELAKKAGVSTSKIRFYEARGILPPAARLANGYRDHDAGALDIVIFVHRAQSLGFTLDEVAAHLRSPRDDGRKARVRAALEKKLADLDIHMDELSARRTMIGSLIDEIKEA